MSRELQTGPKAEAGRLVAELLGLPFSTYRRHLRAGISKVAEILWQEEIGVR